MKNATTLFVINQATPDAVIKEMAEAASENQTHLSCLLIGAMPVLPMYAYGVAPYGGLNFPDNWDELVAEAREKQRQRVNQVEAIIGKVGVSGDVRSAFCTPNEVRHHVAQSARVCDVAHLAPNLRENKTLMNDAAHGVLFHSPVGLMLNGSPSAAVKRALVAWDSSKASSRAAHVALPYLKEADEVVVACFDPIMTPDKEGPDPGTDVAAWLSHHGCNVTVSQFPSGGREIGEAIQSRAKEVGADLVVLGAYGHARMIQAVFGGTTRTMLEQTSLPILMAH